MATNATRSSQGAAVAAHAVLAQDAAIRRREPSGALADSPQKPSGYGLPCSKCHLYYPADLDACPTCHTKERVSPIAPAKRQAVSQAAPNPAPTPDSAMVEKEREEFLRQFKSQQMNTQAGVTGAAESMCALAEHHTGERGNAEICKACYERLQERLDIAEAALHLDLQEATQIIYDAVWADASDPAKTYENAANAMLTELRKRAGMNTLLSPFQPLPD
jgi:hypothetical protein